MSGLTFKEIKNSESKNFIVTFEVIDYGKTIYKALLSRRKTLIFKNKSFIHYPTKYDYIGLSFISAYPSVDFENDKELNKNFFSTKLSSLLT